MPEIILLNKYEKEFEHKGFYGKVKSTRSGKFYRAYCINEEGQEFYTTRTSANEAISELIYYIDSYRKVYAESSRSAIPAIKYVGGINKSPAGLFNNNEGN